MSTQQGVVKFFNQSKGYGFITTDSGEDVFVHVSGLYDDIQEGETVSFNTEQGKKGINAVDVQLV